MFGSLIDVAQGGRTLELSSQHLTEGLNDSPTEIVPCDELTATLDADVAEQAATLVDDFVHGTLRLGLGYNLLGTAKVSSCISTTIWASMREVILTAARSSSVNVASIDSDILLTKLNVWYRASSNGSFWSGVSIFRSFTVSCIHLIQTRQPKFFFFLLVIHAAIIATRTRRLALFTTRLAVAVLVHFFAAALSH